MTRPRILIDIKGGKNSVRFSELNRRIDLDKKKIIFIPFKRITESALIILISLSFVFRSAAAPTFSGFQKAEAADTQTQRAALEAQLSDLEKQISDQEATIEQYQKQGKSLQLEIKKLEAKVSKANLEIKAINLSLKSIDGEISSTTVQIVQTESEIDSNKTKIADILQAISESDNSNTMEVLLKNPKLSDFFRDLNDLVSIQDNLRMALEQVVESRQKLLVQQETLAQQRLDKLSLKQYQDAQKASIEQIKSQKNDLLKVTKGKESEYTKLLVETKKTAAEIRKQIFQLLGGGEIQFDEAYRLAKLAERATGVRAALILAVLDRESALGKNVGRCDYKTAMNPTRDIPIFLTLVNQLGLRSNLDNGLLKVSCPNIDGAYGGAMGPAQFIPSTWALYTAKVSSLTGNNPASPWNNGDAFMATALYLRDAGAASATLGQERVAAAKYYAGARWRTYLWTYGDRVVTQAQKFQEDINILNA